MVRKTLVALAFATAVLSACASRQVGTTTTTSGVIERGAPACAHVESSCELDAECCSLWCVGGLCERREP
jgi:hypothetical protein